MTVTKLGAGSTTRSGDAVPERIIDATLTCVRHFGVSKTTVEDVAETAGCSRATLYRYFPGKQALLEGVVEAELRRIVADLDAKLSDAENIEDALVAIFVHVGQEFLAHEALQSVLEREPELVLPHVTFEGAQRLFAAVALLLSPTLSRFLPATESARAGEWVARIALTYLFCPSEHVSLTDDESVRYLVRTFVLPGFVGPTVGATPANT